MRRLARGAWTPAALAWALFWLFLLGFAAVAWLDHLQRQAGRPDLNGLRPEYIYSMVGVTSAALAGVVVASRRPRNPVGWLLLVFGLLIILGVVADAYVGYAVVARPGALPAADAAVVAAYALGDAGTPVPVLAVVLLLTPTGSLPSPRWQWLARALVAITVANLLTPLHETRPLDASLQSVTSPVAVLDLTGTAHIVGDAVLGGGFLLAILAAAAALVVRFRRARGVERQQLKWVALAAALVPVAVLLTMGGGLAGDLLGQPEVTRAAELVPGLITWLVPMALAAAVLRYRLYDIDRIISRTLAYALLTLTLAAGYAVVVLALSQPLGHGSNLAVAGATLAVAAVFQPARKRIQALVDRRFNRHRYDAARTVQAFGARLRDEIDLDALTRELLGVVDQTVQPTRVSLWLRQG